MLSLGQEGGHRGHSGITCQLVRRSSDLADLHCRVWRAFDRHGSSYPDCIGAAAHGRAHGHAVRGNAAGFADQDAQPAADADPHIDGDSDAAIPADSDSHVDGVPGATAHGHAVRRRNPHGFAEWGAGNTYRGVHM